MEQQNLIVKDLEYDHGEGALRYKGVRYLLIRPETLAGIQKTIEEGSGSAGGEPLYKGGFEGGYLSSKKYREIHGFTDLEIIEFMVGMGGQIGWGRFHLDRYDREARILEVSVEASPFAEACKGARRPVCHLIRGVVAGMGSALLGVECAAEETTCKALGDDRCRFAVVGVVS